MESVTFWHHGHKYPMISDLRLEVDNDDNIKLIGFCICFLLEGGKIQLARNCQK